MGLASCSWVEAVGVAMGVADVDFLRLEPRSDFVLRGGITAVVILRDI